MGIENTASTRDITDNSNRQLGQISIINNYQDEYLPLIFEQLQLISVLLAIIAEENIDVDMEVDVDDLIDLNKELLTVDEGI